MDGDIIEEITRRSRVIYLEVRKVTNQVYRTLVGTDERKKLWSLV